MTSIKAKTLGPVCANCGALQTILFTCSKCKMEQYCSKSCQSAHWTNVHRKLCIKPQDRIPSKFDAVAEHTSTTKYTPCVICLD